MRKTAIIITTILVTLTFLNAQNIREHKKNPEGIYKTIVIEKQNIAISNLSGKNKKQIQSTLDSVLNKPNDYIPPVLYALSKVLFDENKKDDATYWFYVAQLRARYDSNLCLDISARSGVTVLNQTYGPEINKYAFQNIEKLKEIVTKVVDFVKNNNENYDHRWLNLHGMNAIMNIQDKELIEPESNWEQIKTKTIDDYYKGFTNYLKSVEQ
jgi:hypothetical protein